MQLALPLAPAKPSRTPAALPTVRWGEMADPETEAD